MTHYSRALLAVGLPLICAAAYGCRPTADASCNQVEGSYSAVYAGSVNGTGGIVIEPADSSSYSVTVQLVGPKDKDGHDEILVRLAGRGTCRNGMFRAQFGAGSDKNGGLKVLGGDFSALVDRRMTDEPFGRWSAEVLDLRTSEKHAMNGFWGSRSMNDTGDVLGQREVREAAAKVAP
jgi:hypothetical protein